MHNLPRVVHASQSEQLPGLQHWLFTFFTHAESPKSVWHSFDPMHSNLAKIIVKIVFPNEYSSAVATSADLIKFDE